MRRSKYLGTGTAGPVRDAQGSDGPRDPEGIAKHDPYRQIIKRTLASMHVAGADAEDLGQEILLEVIATVGARAVASMPRLVSRISRCRSADYLRARRVRRGVAYDDERDGELLPESRRPFPTQDRLLEERERVEVLDRVLDKLDPDLREVFCLVEVEGMTVALAAEALHLPEPTVRGRWERAKRRFERLAGMIRALAERERRGGR